MSKEQPEGQSSAGHAGPNADDGRHIPVLFEETLNGLHLGPNDSAIDATLGGGSHTAGILTRTAPQGRVLGLDADPAAIERVGQRFSREVAEGRLLLAHAHFETLAEIAQTHGFTAVQAVLLDLGASSFQFDTAARGFSLMQDGPLDMRFDPAQSTNAADIVNTWPEQELADLIYQWGEERRSRRIARYLVQQRPFTSTLALARAIEQAVGGRRGARIHPATRTFQALRIAVNRELEQLEQALPQALACLRPGGRLAVISFHSLEDRIVKQWMQAEASDFIRDRRHPMGGTPRRPTLRTVTSKPITPAAAETAQNPRSRSAKLRIAERLPPQDGE